METAPQSGGEPKVERLSQSYQFKLREKDGELIADIRGPGTSIIEAVLEGTEQDRTLKLRKLLKPNGDMGEKAGLFMVKELIKKTEEALAKDGVRLGHIEVSADGDQSLSHFFHLAPIGALFGPEAIKAGKALYQSRAEEDLKRRKTDEKLGPIILKIEDFNLRLEEYEHGNGKIEKP